MSCSPTSRCHLNANNKDQITCQSSVFFLSFARDKYFLLKVEVVKGLRTDQRNTLLPLFRDFGLFLKDYFARKMGVRYNIIYLKAKKLKAEKLTYHISTNRCSSLLNFVFFFFFLTLTAGRGSIVIVQGTFAILSFHPN